MDTTIFRNGRIFTAAHRHNNTPTPPFCDAMIIAGDRIVHVGSYSDAAVTQARASGAPEIDLHHRVVVPGFIDAHLHLVDFALSRKRLSLLHCKTLDEIRAAIRAYAAAHPAEPRIACKSWIQVASGGQDKAVASLLDDLDPRPIYIAANDMHSGWLNTAALKEIGAADLSNPPGGEIVRDEHGQPTGLLVEMAFLSIVPPYLIRATPLDDKLAALDEAAAAYTAAGYTGMIDMAMDDAEWDVLQAFRARHRPSSPFPFHIAAHWLIPYSPDQAEVLRAVDHAIALHAQYHPSTSPDFCIVGIKLMLDGVVDGCTAALTHPYAGAANPVDPTWPTAALQEVVRKADAAGLQIAMHAIGDNAVKQAIDAVDALPPTTGTRGRRHRIEHLELTSPEDARRLGQLGITASVQPVHSDPVLFRAWPELIGQHRCSRAFAYREFLEGGAPLAFGTDSPTAEHLPLPNLYNATTRRSAIEPASVETVNSHFGVSLAAAVAAMTAGAAYARFADGWTGQLKAGLQADFAVLEVDWRAEELLRGRVVQTWARGRKIYEGVEEGETTSGKGKGKGKL